METDQSAHHHHLYGVPAPSPLNSSTSNSSIPYLPQTYTIHQSNHPLQPLQPLPIIPSPASIPPPLPPPGYAFYPPPVAPQQYQAPHYPPQSYVNNSLAVLSTHPRKYSRRAKTASSTFQTPNPILDTNPSGDLETLASDSLPPKPKKAKTPARLAREMARKLKHRERRRIGRRERRMASKNGDERGDEIVALEDDATQQSNGEAMSDGSDSGEAIDGSPGADISPGRSNGKRGVGMDGTDDGEVTTPRSSGFSKGGSVLDGGESIGVEEFREADLDAGNSRRQSLTVSEAESGIASSLGSGLPGFDGPNAETSHRGPPSRSHSGHLGSYPDESEIDQRGDRYDGRASRQPPTGPRFQPPTGPRADYYRFGDNVGRGYDGPRRDEDGFHFETDSRGLQFPQTETGFRDRRYRDHDRRAGDRRGFHTDSARRFNDRERDRDHRAPLPAHDRPILHLRRSATPEQYPAMVAAKRQRMDEEGEVDMDIDSSDESSLLGEGIILPSSLPEDNQETPASSMFVASQEKPAEETASLDPEASQESNTGKKLDVIAMIRQAKKELLGNRKDTSAASGDFISLSGLDDEGSNPKKPEDSKPIPTGPQFSHRDFLHTQEPVNKSITLDRGFAPGTASATEPLPPPPGLDNNLRKKRTYQEMDPLPAFTRNLPWVNPEAILDNSTSLYGSVWLHKEVIDFYNYIKPRPYEHVVRHDLVRRLRQIVRQRWPDADIRSFGSFAAEIYLPSSDMDVVLVSEQFLQTSVPKYNSVPNIRTLASLLRRSNIPAAGSLVPIVGARVPIIKYKDRLTGLSVDISFENSSGLVANRTFKQWKEVYPEMPKLALLLKHFLAINNINEPFNGGLGSFSLICMIVSLLQLMPEASSGNWNGGENLSLGRLLMEFLELYGTKFNTETTGIRVREPGYFKKSRRSNFYNVSKPWLLSIEDPNDADNNISKATYKIREIQSEFSKAYRNLNERMTRLHSMPFQQRRGESVLAPILSAFDYSNFGNQRKMMAEIFLSSGMGSIDDLKALGGENPHGSPVIRYHLSDSPGDAMATSPDLVVPPVQSQDVGGRPKPASKNFQYRADRRQQKKDRRAAKVKNRAEQNTDANGGPSRQSGTTNASKPKKPKKHKKDRKPAKKAAN
ncbi:hypothetical protein ABW19_dt0201378 [Dactylella cylindrospora]|nr:hypothetical protein ABW19_dt0201378 [Dactylella cylindrospora]